MIIANGTIEIKKKQVAEIDPATGYAVAPTAVSWGRPIACQYSALSYNKLARSNGEPHTSAQYNILIEQRPFNAEQIRLRDRYGNIIGEYSVIQMEPLDAVCEIRIIV